MHARHSGGQFAGYKLDAIARAIGQSVGQPYPIDVVVQADVGEPFPDATIECHETSFALLERLCHLRSILATDDEQGRLVLTTAGNDRATDALLQWPGGNVQWAGAVISGARRFSQFKVKAQQSVHGSASPADSWQGVQSGSAGAASAAWAAERTKGAGDDYASEGDAVASDAQVPVLTEVKGAATDPGVPRYRPHVVMAGSALDGPGAMRRAVWQAAYNAARGTQARVIVPGWRQSDGSLWRINQLVNVRVPFLSLDIELLIAGTSYMLNAFRGRHTELTVGPVDGYQPDPGQVKQRRHRKNQHRGGAGPNWDGVKKAGSDASYTISRPTLAELSSPGRITSNATGALPDRAGSRPPARQVRPAPFA